VRRLLDALYDGAAWFAALCLIGLLATVLLSIVSRQMNFHVPGTDAYAGYLMAASGFMALAHTLKRGEHIRVTVLIGALRGRARHALELWALLAGALLALLFAGYSVKLAWQSYAFSDISTASDATPLWLPQIPMALGACILVMALIDELVLELRGKRQNAVSDEMTRNE
jgi:TRAP-type C4-dicarboxylate transport system permease small subunit